MTEFRESLFRAKIRKQSTRYLQWALELVAFLILITWPTDYFYFADTELIKSYFIWRSVTLAGIVLLLTGINISRWIRKRIFVCIYIPLLIDVILTGFLFGRIKSLESPWFYVIYVLPIISMVLIVSLPWRILTTFCLPLVFSTTFVVFQPKIKFKHFDFVTTIVIAISLISIAIGHLIYRLLRSTFHQQRQLKIQRQRIKELADYDQLTGLLNRREFENKYETEFKRTQRYDLSLCALMADLDHFKKINDSYGHQTGDRVLEVFGEIIQAETRASDIPGRYGGEEFCVILTETDIAGSQEIANRLRETLCNHTFTDPDGNEFSVSCSIGLAELTENMDNLETLLNRADEALYKAKSNGRNRIKIAEKQ